MTYISLILLIILYLFDFIRFFKVSDYDQPLTVCG